MSHYMCNDQNCLAKKFIAFKNAEELRLHRIQYHDRNAIKKIDVKELLAVPIVTAFENSPVNVTLTRTLPAPRSPKIEIPLAE